MRGWLCEELSLRLTWPTDSSAAASLKQARVRVVKRTGHLSEDGGGEDIAPTGITTTSSKGK